MTTGGEPTVVLEALSWPLGYYSQLQVDDPDFSLRDAKLLQVLNYQRKVIETLVARLLVVEADVVTAQAAADAAQVDADATTAILGTGVQGASATVAARFTVVTSAIATAQSGVTANAASIASGASTLSALGVDVVAVTADVADHETRLVAAEAAVESQGDAVDDLQATTLVQADLDAHVADPTNVHVAANYRQFYTDVGDGKPEPERETVANPGLTETIAEGGVWRQKPPAA